MHNRTQRPTVIILDGNQRSALAATRSLGMKGIDVVVGAETLESLASSSRYCARNFSYPSPAEDPHAFLHSIIAHSGGYRSPVLFPMTDVTLNEILLNRDRLPGPILLPFPDYDSYDDLTNKEKLFRLAIQYGIPMPQTLFSSDFKNKEDLISEATKMQFPLVVKSAYSRARMEGKYVSSSALYVGNAEELKDVMGREPFTRTEFLVQKRIHGPGIGIFLLAQDGNICATFAHRRIREKPPSGGVSVLSESIHPPAGALEYSTRLLSSVRWNGVAMVEFKWDTIENCPKLIEVNGRFWGSLNLAVRAGVDFPYLLYRVALGEKISGPAEFRIGVKSRWELGDLDHLLIRLKNPAVLSPDGIGSSKRAAIRDFIVDFFRPSVVHEIFEIKDIGPFLFEAREYLKSIWNSVS